MKPNIRILSSTAIDSERWNACISAQTNGLIYSRYEYLDAICDQWHGMVIDDYAAVMALPWREKMGIRYLYQPPFIQQLGMVGEVADYDAVIQQLLSFCRYGDVLLNFGNAALAQHLEARPCTNFVIDLQSGYETIHARYSKDLLANLRKAARANLQVARQNEVALAIGMYREIYGARIPQVTSVDYKRFENLALQLSEQRRCFTRKIQDAEGNLLSIGLFLQDGRRVYNMMTSTTMQGRMQEANHLLLDSVIREFSGQPLLFDFEGSDLQGVKQFYEKFGGRNQPCFFYHFNRLPFFIRWMKR